MNNWGSAEVQFWKQQEGEKAPHPQYPLGPLEGQDRLPEVLIRDIESPPSLVARVHV